MGEPEKQVNASLLPGDEVHGFVLDSIDVLDDYHGYGYFFRHRITGMEVYHVANDDPENFFGFIFKTPPVDDCGTPHIIEHCVLAGSGRYPVRDPFMSLLKGSVNTFMNAMTYPDYTVYPAASPLANDYRNLFAIYADAVFNPLLREETFWQEGIRIMADEGGKLKYDGVVYNEMLGELSDHDSIVGRQSIRSLYPDTPYFYESGGDPAHIIRLNYRQFIGYHASHYHPSNCRLFLYGNQEISWQLALLDDLYLADSSAMSCPGATVLAKPWAKPKTVHATSPAEADGGASDDASVAVSWATSVVEDPIEVLTLTVLTDILLGNPGAPLYKAIIDSHLAKDISQISGMDTSFRQMPFTVGFKGIDPKDAQKAEDLVIRTLEEIVRKGIPRKLVMNALKRQEFLLQELSGDIPIGLRAMNRAVRGWLQGQRPHVTIGVSAALGRLKELVAESMPDEDELFAKGGKSKGSDGYFERWISSRLLENPHRCLLVVKPDAEHNRLLEETISQRLSQVAELLGKDGLARLQTENQRFLAFEESEDEPEALATIPRLGKDDLPKSIRVLHQQDTDLEGVPLWVQRMETNGIIYTDGMLSVGDLDAQEQLLLPLLTRMLHMTGVEDIPYDEVAVMTRERTGGLYFFLESSSMVRFADSSFSALAFRMKCLERDHAPALQLLFRILNGANVRDTERLGAVVNDLVSDYESNVTSAGQMYASQRASASFSRVLAQNEAWNGLAQWFHLKGHDPNDRFALERLGEALEAVRTKIARRHRMLLHLCVAEQSAEEARKHLGEFVLSFTDGNEPALNLANDSSPFAMPSTPELEIFRIPSSVSFSATVCKAAEPFDPVQAHQTVLAHVLTTNHLWTQVRGLGGAYGVSAHIDMLERLCLFSSYRDPRIEGTLRDFRDVVAHVAEEGVDQDLIDFAIISLVGREIKPLYPKDAAMIAFRRALYGITDTFRSDRRNWILTTTVAQVKEAARHLLESMDAHAKSVVITGQELLEREKAASERLRIPSVKLPV